MSINQLIRCSLCISTPSLVRFLFHQSVSAFCNSPRTLNPHKKSSNNKWSNWTFIVSCIPNVCNLYRNKHNKKYTYNKRKRYCNKLQLLRFFMPRYINIKWFHILCASLSSLCLRSVIYYFSGHFREFFLHLLVRGSMVPKDPNENDRHSELVETVSFRRAHTRNINLNTQSN